jgi:arylesterase/paraoxonase
MAEYQLASRANKVKPRVLNVKIGYLNSKILSSTFFLLFLFFWSSFFVVAKPGNKKFKQADQAISIEITDTIFGALGAGDITVDRRTGIAFIACDYRRDRLNDDNIFQGAVYGLDLNAEKPFLRHLTSDFPHEFHPQGISFYSDPETGQERLFVINRRRKHNYIEIFKWENKKLIHLESITHTALVSPNDIQATGLRSFYFTNDHGSRSAFGVYLEDILGLRKANISYFDGKTFRAVAGRLLYANGIQLSFENNKLYVSSTLKGRVYQYARDPINGALVFEKYYKVSRGLDNLELDENGDLWVCANTNLIKYLRQAYIENAKSPWRLYRIRVGSPPLGEKGIVEEVYRSNGKEISAVSIAAFYKRQILFGSFYEDYILAAKMNDWRSNMLINSCQERSASR